MLCEHVRRYLARFTHDAGITDASIEGAVSSGARANIVAPNRYGMTENSHRDVLGRTYFQPSDYLLLNAGVVAYQE